MILPQSCALYRLSGCDSSSSAVSVRSCQARPIATFDLDIVPARSSANCNRLAHVLEALGAHYRGHPKRIVPTSALLQSPGHHLLSTQYGPLDVLGTIGKDHDYRQLSKSARALAVEPGLRVRVVPLSLLIEIKQETARDKDRAVLHVLRQTLAEQQRTRHGNRKR